MSLIQSSLNRNIYGDLFNSVAMDLNNTKKKVMKRCLIFQKISNYMYVAEKIRVEKQNRKANFYYCSI